MGFCKTWPTHFSLPILVYLIGHPSNLPFSTVMHLPGHCFIVSNTGIVKTMTSSTHIKCRCSVELYIHIKLISATSLPLRQVTILNYSSKLLLWHRKLSKFDICYNCSNFGHLNTGQTIPKRQNPRTIQCVGLATKPLLLITAIASSGHTKKIGLRISHGIPQYGSSNPVNKSLMQYNSNFYHSSQFYARVSRNFL